MNKSDLIRNSDILRGSISRKGYIRWWHSFVGVRPDTGETRTFFVEYSMINPALGGKRPLLGQHPRNRRAGIKPSYLNVRAGVLPNASDDGLLLQHYEAIDSLKITCDPFYMEIDNCSCSENHIAGALNITPAQASHRSLMTDSGIMEWNLEMHKEIACHIGGLGSALACIFHLLQDYWHGEGIRTLYRGNINLNGIVYEVTPETCCGYADKHWGRKCDRPHFQFASCNLHSERMDSQLKHCALAINSVRTNKLILQLNYRGEDFYFSHCRWETKITKKRFVWHIIAKNKNAIVKLSGTCLKENMMPLRFESPDGVYPASPLWIGGEGTGTIRLYRRMEEGREFIDTLTAENTLCFYQK